MDKLYLLPYDQYSGNCDFECNDGFEVTELLGGNYSTFESAKSAIRWIANHLNLQREDEVYISTTTESSFVSTCVSATLFNYCRLSRILSESTKLIFVIHEFGYPNQRLPSLIEFGRKHNIPVIEDVAHSLNSDWKGIRLGSSGDYAIHSLPKCFPTTSGGILYCKDQSLSESRNAEAEDSIKKWGGYIEFFKKRKIEIANRYKKLLGYREEIFNLSEGLDPFVFGFKTDQSEEINWELEAAGFQVGRTYVSGFVLLPVNPFASDSLIDDCVKIILTVESKRYD